MLAKVAIAIAGTSDRRRVGSLLPREDVDREIVRTAPFDWGQMMHASADVYVVSHDLIPSPLPDTIAQLRDLPSEPGLIVFTTHRSVEEQAALRAAGADAVIYADLDDDVIRDTLATALRLRAELITKRVAARRSVARPRISDFVTSSPAMQTFMQTVNQVSGSDVPLFILGETGVGKERLARALHGESRREGGPFISVNCGAVPEHLIESELFGHVEGAFTGATRSRRGCFEMAHRGTIFLDEIGEMPLQLQVKLLHVLQDYEIRAVGSERTISVDVRIMAATNRNIIEEIAHNRFRQDLYYRLSVVKLRIPSLRERTDDIPDLAQSFVGELSLRVGKNIDGMTSDALEALCRYSWPGNIRELINVIERAVLLCKSNTITLAELPEEISGSRPESLSHALLHPPEDRSAPLHLGEAWMALSLKEARDIVAERFERTYLEDLLTQEDGRIGATARRAGIQTRTLYSKMKQYGLRKEDYKTRDADNGSGNGLAHR